MFNPKKRTTLNPSAPPLAPFVPETPCEALPPAEELESEFPEVKCRCKPGKRLVNGDVPAKTDSGKEINGKMLAAICSY